jgi:DNA polymerase III alpha subunit
MWDALYSFHQKEKKDISGLFDCTQKTVPVLSPGLHQQDYSPTLKLKHERETLGLIFSVHPLELYGNSINIRDYVSAKDLPASVGKQATTIGWPITGKTVQTKAGEPMKFVSFEDQTGIYETVFFPKAYHRFCHMLNLARPFILKGKIEEEFGAVTMTVNWMGFLDNSQGNIHLTQKLRSSSC